MPFQTKLWNFGLESPLKTIILATDVIYMYKVFLLASYCC